MSIVVVGLSHHTAPVEIRDGVAVPEHALRSVLKTAHRLPGVAECAVVSTCNRSETYVVTDTPEAVREGVAEMLCGLSGLAPGRLRKYLFTYCDADAVRHLFEVASGLDSMIVGEPQIGGQVKAAGAAAVEAGTSRTVLSRLFRSAGEASKRARTETEIGVGAVSVSFAAVELARKIFGDLDGRSALVIGAGEMSELTARYLVENGVRAPMVASRTRARTQALAERVGGEAMGWQDAMEGLHRADIVISSTSAPTCILRKDAVAAAMQRRRNRQMFLIDIAVPRDIEPEVGELYNVLLYNIDDLQLVVGANLKKRRQEAEKVRVILEEEVAAFLSWLNSLDVVPAIMALRRHFQEVMEAELERARLSDLTDEQKANVADVVRRYMNKLLHEPVTRLKGASDTGNGLVYVDALMHLFGLRMGAESEPDGALEERKRRVERIRS